MLRLAVIFILLTITAAKKRTHRKEEKTHWTTAVQVLGNGDYLCTCAHTAVGADMMSPGPHPFTKDNITYLRSCNIDGSLERHRYICAYFHEYNIEDFLHRAVCHSNGHCRALRVLHNAPEIAVAAGLHLLNSSSVDYMGFDFEVGPLVFNSKLNEFRANLMELPFPTSFADVLITSHVLEHVPDLDQALKEIYRVLRPGRLAVIAAPVNISVQVTKEMEKGKNYTAEDLKRDFGQEDHVRTIGMDIIAKIEAVGFMVDRMTPVEFYEAFFPQGKQNYRNIEFTEFYQERGIFMAFKPSKRYPQPPYLRRDKWRSG